MWLHNPANVEALFRSRYIGFDVPAKNQRVILSGVKSSLNSTHESSHNDNISLN